MRFCFRVFFGVSSLAFHILTLVLTGSLPANVQPNGVEADLSQTRLARILVEVPEISMSGVSLKLRLESQESY